MLHTFPGDFGHLALIFSFVSCLLTALGYGFSLSDNDQEKAIWLRFGRISFGIHVLGVFIVAGSLFYIIYHHYYEYYYAWSHSSNSLPTHYMISCFWEGQEGSFLLWLFWHCVLGIFLVFTQRSWEAPVMILLAVVQFFLTSMILGVVIFNVKVGSSPFILLREFMTDAPIFKARPDYIPADGTGLNPLLQNYWMVIHPPTLFLGFAAMFFPYAFCMAGLWQGRYTEWIRPALPWALFAALVLGIGILMGGYWAYETLNFGGYWNWDPVENAVYVPWLVLVAAIHGMIIHRNNQAGIRTSIGLVTGSFLLILYSTFLTRSGILGNASVHSFTDLGLSGQLLIYLLAFILLSAILLIIRWKNLPGDKAEITWNTREFWVFLGAITLCMAAFQIIFTTSIPVYNKILELFSIRSNVALPADQIAHYSKYQLWFSVAIALLSGTGQFFYWQKNRSENPFQALWWPTLAAMLLSSLVITVTGVNQAGYIILLTASIYSLCGNAIILFNMLKKSPSLSGGAVAHIGIALMFIGVLYSAGYSKVVSKNTTGLLYSKEFTSDMNAENILLWRDMPYRMGEYELLYKGPRVEASGTGGYINKESLLALEEKGKAILTEDIVLPGGQKHKKGDTIRYSPENTYYEIDFKKGEERFTLFPRAQVNAQMGGLLASPDIKKMWGKDLYTHVSSIPDPEQEREWKEQEEKTVQIGDTFLLNDYFAIMKGVTRVTGIPGIALNQADVAVKATVEILGRNKNYVLEPIFLIKDQMIGRIPDINLSAGVRLVVMNIDPQQGHFTLGISTTQKDWVILKAMEKPYIDLLWLGALLVSAGFGIALVRRYKAFRQMRDKGLE